MELWSPNHIIYLLITCLIIVSMMVIISKVDKKKQTIILYVTGSVGVLGIFFRYAMNLSFDPQNFSVQRLALEMFQICNFNFILIPLAMIKKFEGVRQYLFMFSMLAASTAFVFYDYDIANNQWYSLNTINFWVNHLVIVLLPLLFVASNRFKPKISYLLPVMFSAFLYVALSGIFSWYLIEFQGVPRESTYSYVFYPEVNAVFRYLYTLIPIYFVYLIPIGVVVAMINAALILLFKRKQIDTF